MKWQRACPDSGVETNQGNIELESIYKLLNEAWLDCGTKKNTIKAKKFGWP